MSRPLQHTSKQLRWIGLGGVATWWTGAIQHIKGLLLLPGYVRWTVSLPSLVEFTSADDARQPGGLGRPRPRSRNNISLLTPHGIAVDDWTSVGCELLMPSLDHDLGVRSEKVLLRSLAGGTSPMNLNL